MPEPKAKKICDFRRGSTSRMVEESMNKVGAPHPRGERKANERPLWNQGMGGTSWKDGEETGNGKEKAVAKRSYGTDK